MAIRFFQTAALVAATSTLCLSVAFAGGRRSVPYEGSIGIEGPQDGGQVTGTPVSPEQVLAARERGAGWLKDIQRDDGGWGAGDWSTDSTQAPADVATTSLVVLALLRDARGGDVHDQAILKGVEYVVRVIEKSPIDTARLDGPEGTQPQYKLGQLVDTHLAAMMLGEVAGHFDDKTDRMVDSAHDKVLIKVQMAQNDDGSFDGNGWAPVLSTSIAQSSIERALELGKEVDDEVLDKNDRYQAGLVSKDGQFDTGAGAGVDLYAAASSLKGNRDAGRRSTSEPARQQAAEAETAAKARIVGDSSGALFNGFGSVGGEEMLSYMMISDTLADEGGDDWQTWDGRVGSWLVAAQNTDGSWAGHHCITSRTFTTAAAMMALGSGDWAQVRASRVTGGDAPAMHAESVFAPDHGTTK